MDNSEDCDICGGELEIEYHYKRRELVCQDCGSILDSDTFGEGMEAQEPEGEVMQ